MNITVVIGIVVAKQPAGIVVSDNMYSAYKTMGTVVAKQTAGFIVVIAKQTAGIIVVSEYKRDRLD